MNRDSKIPIKISLSRKLLRRIEENISGENRSQKICKCLAEGYRILMKGDS